MEQFGAEEPYDPPHNLESEEDELERGTSKRGSPEGKVCNSVQRLKSKNRTKGLEGGKSFMTCGAKELTGLDECLVEGEQRSEIRGSEGGNSKIAESTATESGRREQVLS